MNKIIRISLSSIFMVGLSACSLFGQPNAAVADTPVVRLTVQAQNGATTFSRVDETINYNYVVTNTGTAALAGPVIVADAPRLVQCPEVNTVGNQDIYLDLNETITCTASYKITQADFDTGSVTTLAIANVGGINSNQSGVTLTKAAAAPVNVLALTKTASSQTYGQVGQTITYTYVITNTGTLPIGPTQFTISDDKLGAPVNCGPAATTLSPSQSLNCSFPYLISQADMSATSLINRATASGGGQTSAAATVTIANLNAPATQTPTTIQTATVAPSSNLAPGSTIQHQVAVGEWLIQIGRCYGATFDELRNANPQIADPDFILPSMIVTVPRIGSAGRVYGPPCITFHTVQSGDTWTSIAQRYNADQGVLQLVNPVGLTAGTQIKIPLNSAGSLGVTAVPPTATATGTATPAMRIIFDAGQTTAARVGVVNPNQPVQYVINAGQGQVLSIKLTATANEVAVGVNGPSGLALKPLDATPTWTTTITTGGDHFITLASILGNTSKPYTLEVSLTTPAAPTATITPGPSPTPTNTPGAQ